MESGLSTAEAEKRLHEFGKNRIQQHGTSSIKTIFFSQSFSVINALLAIAAFFAFIIHDILDGSFILAAIIINVGFGFLQEYRAQRSLEKLKQYTAPTARVMRDGREKKILAEELVPGDIVVITEGSQVPADGILLEGKHIEIDESVLSGESLAVFKKPADSVFLGTLVRVGKGTMRVNKTGNTTEFGQIARTLSTIKVEKTPLQRNLDQLGKTLSLLALLAGFLIIIIGFASGKDLIPLILVGTSIGVAAIPEGLPAVVTIAFAVGTHRMAKRGAIIKKLAAIEALGALQIVLIDKTGTLTQNTMAVKKYWLTDEKSFPLLLAGCVLGNTASLIEKGTGRNFETIGDQTDGALLLWAYRQSEKNSVVLPQKQHIIDEYVFDTETKTITTVVRKNKTTHVFVRGAPEEIITKSNCSPKEKAVLINQFQHMANEGLRVIGFGYKTESHHKKTTREHLEQNLTFLGYLGLYDPPRSEAKDAIEKAHKAGIRTIMVTGDNEQTALNLAQEVNLIEKEEDILTGEKLETLSDEELLPLLVKTAIFARTKPEQKLRLVTLLKQQGYVVGVTGDGVNDALALKKADVGIAMGERGTDVAKEASDIVLTDDNFATFIRAVEEGRIIYRNILNAIVYLLSGNLAELSIVFFATLLQLPFPFLPTQILWINLVTDSLPALALATGNHDPAVLGRKPRDPKAAILTFKRIGIICLIGFSLTGFLLALFIFLLHINTQTKSRTVIFNLLIYFHLLIMMALGRHSLKKGNLFLIFSILIIIVFQFIINITPFFRVLFHLEL